VVDHWSDRFCFILNAREKNFDPAFSFTQALTHPDAVPLQCGHVMLNSPSNSGCLSLLRSGTRDRLPLFSYVRFAVSVLMKFPVVDQFLRGCQREQAPRVQDQDATLTLCFHQLTAFLSKARCSAAIHLFCGKPKNDGPTSG
jgi:hypothetical protein